VAGNLEVLLQAFAGWGRGNPGGCDKVVVPVRVHARAHNGRTMHVRNVWVYEFEGRRSAARRSMRTPRCCATPCRA
jgi:hypothetical protein